jgi:hypothetical protein
MDTCACCGYKTITENGNYEICPICYWESDPVQEADPWFAGGANVPSLFQAQMNFQKHDVMEKRFLANVRVPNQNDKKDSSWRELVEEDKNFCTTPREIEDVWGTDEAISYKYWVRNA